jgi:DNA-binding MarR family transcriptional regulator
VTLDAGDYRALAEFRHEIRRFLVFSEEAARGAGIEPRQHQLLLQIAGLSPDVRPTIGTLAARLMIQKHSAVELVDRTEALGLVVRSRSPEDRREVLVSVTPAGHALLARLTRAHRDELRTAAPALVDALQAVMGRIA